MYWFVCVEQSLYVRDKSQLVYVNDLSHAFLDAINQYFVEEFCICIYQGYLSVVLFLCMSISGLEIKVMLISLKEFGGIFYLSIVLSSLRRIGISSWKLW